MAANRLSSALSLPRGEHRARVPSARSRAVPAVVPEWAARWSRAPGRVPRDGPRRPAARLSSAPGVVALRRASVLDPGLWVSFPVVPRAEAPEVAANRLSPMSSRSRAQPRARAPCARSRGGPAAGPEPVAQRSPEPADVRWDGLRGLARSSFGLAAVVVRRVDVCLPAGLPQVPDPGVVQAFRRDAAQRWAVSSALPLALLCGQAVVLPPSARSWAAPADLRPILPLRSLMARLEPPAPLPARMLELLRTPPPGRPLHWPQAWSRRSVAQRLEADAR
jgi:hypothetical protein